MGRGISWEPNGERVVITSQPDDKADGLALGGQSNLKIIDVNTGGIQTIVPTDECDFDPIWSPDGKEIVFMSNRGGNWDLYLVDPATEDLTQLTSDAEIEHGHTWSPNGNKLAFVTNLKKDEYNSLSDYDQSFEYRLVLLRFLESEIESTAVVRPSRGECCFDHPTWAPDNVHLAFVYKTVADDEFHIDVVNVETRERRRIATLPPSP